MKLTSLKDPFQKLFIYYNARLAFAGSRWQAATTFVDAVYRLLLRRSATPHDLETWTTRLQRGGLTRNTLVWEILCSAEFVGLHRDWNLPLDSSMIGNALHATRCHLVKTELPAAEAIVDLGGACSYGIEGALLCMGYPHAPREITIIDLPPDQRMFANTFQFISREQDDWIPISGATSVRYLHRSFVDLTGILDNSVDLLWSGETIEHVTRADARRTAQEAYRVLKPGGYFCLDTPNRALTRLQFPDKLIHPEHKYEYTPAELAEQLGSAGFAIQRTLGICPMPQSIHEGHFHLREIMENAVLTDDAAGSYLFYIEAIKPA